MCLLRTLFKRAMIDVSGPRGKVRHPPMLDPLYALLATVRPSLKSRRELALETLALRRRGSRTARPRERGARTNHPSSEARAGRAHAIRSALVPIDKTARASVPKVSAVGTSPTAASCGREPQP